MTVDDESSVYVGGLAYDSTEDMLQKAFETYGDIMSIKILVVNDFMCPTISHFSGGPEKLSRCRDALIVYDRESGQSRGFGFVTFSNPRSAGKAIHGLDGRVIGGRTIRVNEVKKQGGKTLGREDSFRDRGGKERDHRDNRDRDRDRDREKDRNGRGRNLSPQRNRRPSPASGRSGRGRSPMISPGPGRSARGRSPLISPTTARSERVRSPAHRRSRSPRAARSHSHNSSSAGRPQPRSSQTSPSPRSSERLHRMEENIVRASTMSTRAPKEKHYDVVKVREELEKAAQTRQELENKVRSLQNAVDHAEENVATLQTKSQRLEDSLVSAMAAASYRQQQLRKVQKGILQVRDSTERLTRHEKELKALMNSIASDLEVLDGETEDRHGIMENGGHYDGDRKADDGGLMYIENLK